MISVHPRETCKCLARGSSRGLRNCSWKGKGGKTRMQIVWVLFSLALFSRLAAQVSDGSQYYVLLIITDGVISDMLQTKEAIVSVSPIFLLAWGRVQE